MGNPKWWKKDEPVDADQREFNGLNFKFLTEQVIIGKFQGMDQKTINIKRDEYVQENLSNGNRLKKGLRLDV